MKAKPTLLLYGDVDLNIMDGSAIWVQSIVDVLTDIGFTVDLLLKAAVIDDRIVAHIASRPDVHLVDYVDAQAVVQARENFTPRIAAQRIAQLQQERDYDVILARGFRVCQALANSRAVSGRFWPYVTEHPQSSDEVTPNFVESMSAIARSARKVFLQTEEARSFLEAHVPALAGRAVLLPPMVPDMGGAQAPAAASDKLALVYAGKFARKWRTDLMCKLPQRLRARGIESEAVMIGDKIHTEPNDPTWDVEMRSALALPGVNWVGGLPRSSALARVGQAHVGLAWRDPSMDSSLEISTKLLEYIALGVPPLVNRTVAHERLLGENYPLFVEADDDVLPLLERCVRDRVVLLRAREACAGAADQHSMSAVSKHVQRQFRMVLQHREASINEGRRHRLLVAGHDLKFAGELLEALESSPEFDVKVDHWESLHKHDDSQSRVMLDEADVIFCEWAGPNAVWYSHEKRARQRLIVRLHMFELKAPWLKNINWDAVDTLVCVSDLYRDLARAELPIEADRVVTIPNTIDTDDLLRPKMPDARFHVGFVGVVPIRKRLDRALDLMEELVSADPRFVLHIRGRLPEEYPWEWRKPIFREYYGDAFDRAFGEGPLVGHVTWDYFGPDMGNWLRRIGWVLSPSTAESFHLAPLEGMASGAVPVIWDRPGAEGIFGRRWLVPDHQHAARAILTCADDPRLWSDSSSTAITAAATYDVGAVTLRWFSLLRCQTSRK